MMDDKELVYSLRTFQTPEEAVEEYKKINVLIKMGLYETARIRDPNWPTIPIIN